MREHKQACCMNMLTTQTPPVTQVVGNLEAVVTTLLGKGAVFNVSVTPAGLSPLMSPPLTPPLIPPSTPMEGGDEGCADECDIVPVVASSPTLDSLSVALPESILCAKLRPHELVCIVRTIMWKLCPNQIDARRAVILGDDVNRNLIRVNEELFVWPCVQALAPSTQDGTFLVATVCKLPSETFPFSEYDKDVSLLTGEYVKLKKSGTKAVKVDALRAIAFNAVHGSGVGVVPLLGHQFVAGAKATARKSGQGKQKASRVDVPVVALTNVALQTMQVERLPVAVLSDNDGDKIAGSDDEAGVDDKSDDDFLGGGDDDGPGTDLGPGPGVGVGAGAGSDTPGSVSLPSEVGDTDVPSGMMPRKRGVVTDVAVSGLVVPLHRVLPGWTDASVHTVSVSAGLFIFHLPVWAAAGSEKGANLSAQCLYHLLHAIHPVRSPEYLFASAMTALWIDAIRCLVVEDDHNKGVVGKNVVDTILGLLGDGVQPTQFGGHEGAKPQRPAHSAASAWKQFVQVCGALAPHNT